MSAPFISKIVMFKMVFLPMGLNYNWFGIQVMGPIIHIKC